MVTSMANSDESQAIARSIGAIAHILSRRIHRFPERFAALSKGQWESMVYSIVGFTMKEAGIFSCKDGSRVRTDLRDITLITKQDIRYTMVLLAFWAGTMWQAGQIPSDDELCIPSQGSGPDGNDEKACNSIHGEATK